MLRYSDPEVVPAKELSYYLKKFCKEWLVERPNSSYIGNPNAGWNLRNDNSAEHTPTADPVWVMGPVQYLAEGSGISIRNVGAMCNGNFAAHIGLGTAEKVLQAAGLLHLISSGEIPVIPNPVWSQERYMEHMAERGCI